MNQIFQAKNLVPIPDGTLIAPFLNPKDSMSGLPFDLVDGFSVAQGKIVGNSSSQIHVHPHVDQVIYVLSGRITLKIKGKQEEAPYEVPLGPQQAGISEGGDFFQLINPHNEDCEVLYIVSPAYLYELNDKKEVVYDDSIILPYSWAELAALNWQVPELTLEQHSKERRDKAYKNIKNKKHKAMKTVAYYLVTMLLFLLTLLLLTLSGILPYWIRDHDVVIKCALSGGFGAVSYGFMAIYYHYCKREDWNAVWIPWYFMRPILGIIVGAFTYFFVAAGLLVLEAATPSGASHLGIFALAFVAGLNTDRFIAKIEDVVSNLWGIEPSSISEASLKRSQHPK